MDIRLGYMVAEITRRCNMKCPHCLRGNSQRMDMSNDIINTITRQIEGINMVTFTGGEPSLNSEAIRQFMYGFIYNDCPIDGFWIATNARFYKDDFYNVLNSLYSICGDRECCSLTISGDQYRYRCSDHAYEMYSELLFYSDEKMKTIENWAIQTRKSRNTAFTIIPYILMILCISMQKAMCCSNATYPTNRRRNTL